MKEVRTEKSSGKENHPKNKWIIPHFYDVKWLIFETLWPATILFNILHIILCPLQTKRHTDTNTYKAVSLLKPGMKEKTGAFGSSGLTKLKLIL